MQEATSADRRPDALVRARLRHEIAKASDRYYTIAKDLAQRMRETDLKTHQIRTLENVAYTTDKVSDIMDLVKKQTGRGKWRLEIGQQMLDTLDERQSEALKIAQPIDPHDDDLPRRVHLLLCRELIKHVAAHVLYASKLREDEGPKE